MPRLYAHRGGAKLWPENTLFAFQKAVELGVFDLELDVHLSADGKLVVIHDETVSRTCNRDGRVDELNWAEISRLDAGYHFQKEKHGDFLYRGQGLSIPLLEDVFALDPRVRVNLDIKAHTFDAAETLWKAIQNNNWSRRIVVASEHDPTIRHFRELAAGEVESSASRREVRAFVLRSWAKLKSKQLPYQYLQVPPVHRGIKILRPGLIHFAHEQGIQVHAWTIDHAEEMSELLRMGVDGIMSDRPDLFSGLDEPIK